MSRSLLLAAFAAVALVGCSGDSTEPKAAPPEPAAAPAVPDASAGASSGVSEPGTAHDAATFEVGQSWRLIDASTAELRDNAVKAGIFLEVQDGRLVGYSGCNRFSAAITARGPGAITLGPAMSSKRACVEDALNAAEQQFLAALQKVESYQLIDGELRFEHADGTRLVFVEGRPEGMEPAAE